MTIGGQRQEPEPPEVYGGYTSGLRYLASKLNKDGLKFG